VCSCVCAQHNVTMFSAPIASHRHARDGNGTRNSNALQPQRHIAVFLAQSALGP
jgi:hypothetical protein